MQTAMLPARGQSKEQNELTLRDVWYTALRHRWLIIGATVLGAGVATLYALRSTPVYHASTSIRIDERQSSLPVLDILKDVGGGSELATEMEVLRSRSLAQTVVDSLKLQVTVSEPKSAVRDQLLNVISVAESSPVRTYVLRRRDGGFVVDDSLSTIYRAGDVVHLVGADIVLLPAALESDQITVGIRPFRSAVADLGTRLSVTRPSREANMVVVGYQGSDPKLVRDIPNVLADNFIKSQAGVKKTEARSTIDFLRSQIDTISRQLSASEHALRQFREREGVVSLPDEASAQIERFAALQAERASIDGERAALAALLVEVRTAAATVNLEDPSPYRRLLAFPTLLRNQAISQQLASLNAVESERTTLLMRRTARDPDVVTLSARVRDMEEQIRVLATTYLQGLTNQVASIDEELARFNNRLQQVPAKEIEFARLVRQPKILEELYVTLQSRLKEAEVAQAVEDASVRVIDSAISPDRPIKPNKPLIILMGGMLGMMSGVAGAFLRKSLDQKVRSRADIVRITGTVVLGIIPRIQTAAQRRLVPRGSLLKRLAMTSTGMSSSGKLPTSNGEAELATGFASRLVAGNDPQSPIAEAYRGLRTNITFARLDNPPKTLVFTSAMPGDGKSTTSSNLAITLAQQGQRVLLVDADMRKGVLHEVFNQRRNPGLSNLIMGSVELSEAVRTIPVGLVTVDFLPTGTFPPNPAELLGSEIMRKLLKRLESTYDMIILDSPPLNVVTDAALLGTKSDGVVVITRADKTTVTELEYAMLQLMNVRAPVLGIVLNDIDVKAAQRYGYGSYQAYFSEAE